MAGEWDVISTEPIAPQAPPIAAPAAPVQAAPLPAPPPIAPAPTVDPFAVVSEAPDPFAVVSEQPLASPQSVGAQMPYETALSPEDELKFQDWKKQYAPKDSGADYDLRGAFKAGLTPDPTTGHWPDTFKKPNHPTFSDQSMYARPPYAAAAQAGHWIGDTYVPPGAPENLPAVRNRVASATYEQRQLDSALAPVADALEKLRPDLEKAQKKLKPVEDGLNDFDTQLAPLKQQYDVLSALGDPGAKEAADNYNAILKKRQDLFEKNAKDIEALTGLQQQYQSIYEPNAPFFKQRDDLQAEINSLGRHLTKEQQQSVFGTIPSVEETRAEAQNLPMLSPDAIQASNLPDSAKLQLLSDYMKKAPGGKSSMVGAAARGAERGALPAAGGMMGFAAGAEAIQPFAAPAAAMTGPAAPFIEAGLSLLGGALGAYAGSGAAGDVQSEIAAHIPDSVVKALGQDAEQQAADIKEHPYATFAGELAPNLLFMRPGFGTPPPFLEGTPTINRILSSPVTARAAGAAITGAQEAAGEHFQGENLDPGKIAIAAASGALMEHPTKAGAALMAAGAAPVRYGYNAIRKAMEPGPVYDPSGHQKALPPTPPVYDEETGEIGEPEPPEGPPEPFTPGSPLYLKPPKGGTAPIRTTVVGTSQDGAYTKLRHANGTERIYKTDQVMRDMVPGPEAQPEGEPVSEAEVMNVPHEEPTRQPGEDREEPTIEPPGVLQKPKAGSLAGVVPGEPTVAKGAEQPTPPPAPGMIRLYRGEVPGERATSEGSAVTGGWFATTPERAATFGPVHYVDVSRKELGDNFAMGPGRPDTDLVTTNQDFRARMQHFIPPGPEDQQREEPSSEKPQRGDLIGEKAAPIKGGSVFLRNSYFDEHQGQITAHDPATGKQVGQMIYAHVEGEGGLRYNPDVHVDEAYRHRGIASAMYDFAEEQGAKIPEVGQPGQVRTTEGQAFREARAKSGEQPEGTGHRETPVHVETEPQIQPARNLVDTNATPAQKRAENYQSGHVVLHGLPITIETPKGTERLGHDDQGNVLWRNTNPLADYGRIKGTEGNDGEQLDIYIGPHPESRRVFVIDQYDPKTGNFDETKSVGGVSTPDEAKEIYDAGFSDNSGPERRRGITELSIDQFKNYAKNGNHKVPAEEWFAPEEGEEPQVPTIVPGREYDSKGAPIFKKGERVTLNMPDHNFNGRSGVISDATGMTWRPIFGGSGKSETTYTYQVKTDNGATTFASPKEMQVQEGEPPPFVPDPVVDGTPLHPLHLESNIQHYRSSAEKAQAASGRAIKPQNKRHYANSAKGALAEADKRQRILDAWKAKYPEEAAKVFPVKPQEMAAKPETPVISPHTPPAPGVEVRENPARNGIEVKFKQKPSPADMAKLKGAGFKWSGRQKLWYAKASDKTRAVANSFKGEPETSENVAQPTPSAPQDERVAFRAALSKDGEATHTNGTTYLVYPFNMSDGSRAYSVRVARPGTRNFLTHGLPTRNRGEAIRRAFEEAFPDTKGVEEQPPEPTGNEAKAAAMAAMRNNLNRTGAHRQGNADYSIQSARRFGRPDTYYYRKTEGGTRIEHGEGDGWERDKAIDEAVQDAFRVRQPATPPKALQWREVGKNRDGEILFEDQNGVRSLVKNGARLSEPVGLHPTREGMRFTTDRKANPEYEVATPEEQLEHQAKAAAAEAEMNAAEYQPGNMPMPQVTPQEPAVKPFQPGDIAKIRPEHQQQLPPGPEEHGVVGTSSDGEQVELEGGARVNANQLESPKKGGKVENELPAELPDVVPGETQETGSEDVSGTGEVGTNAPAPPGQVPRSERPNGSTTRGGGKGSGRPAKGHAGVPSGGGEGAGPNAGPAHPGETTDPRTTGRPEDVEGQNYRIEPGALAEGRSPKTKALDNIRAIELVKQIKREGRLATAEEQRDLAKYVGWGGLSGAFPDHTTGEYGTGLKDVGKRLLDLLNPNEYAQARASTPFAHYTAENVINAMWKAVSDMGFKGGDVFEPGMGVAHFLGLMPPEIAAVSRYQGLERDPITADIAKLLYPKSGVRTGDYIQTPMPPDIYDLAIGNPPFNQMVVKADPKYKARGFELHDYFFAKTLDSVRPGGLLAFVTSAGTMNKLDTAARAYMGERAEFVGGVRLPSSAFKQNANTEVTTDILFFKKRQEPLTPKAFDELFGKEDPDAAWADTTTRELPNNEGQMQKGQVSRYFSEHPEMVLGQEGFFDKLYKGRYAVHPIEDRDLSLDLAEALNRLPKDIMDAPARDDPDKALMDLDASEKKDGSYYLKDGKLYQYSGGKGLPVSSRGAGQSGMTKEGLARVLKLIPIRDAYREVIKHDLAENTPFAAIAREKLNKAYDDFVEKFGPINKAEYQYRRPAGPQMEGLRQEAREEARAVGAPWDDGSFDTQELERAGASNAEIARARAAAREKPGYSEGSFDPEKVEDIVIEKLPNIDPFMDDPESYRLRSIEHYDPETGNATKKRVFRESVITRDLEPNLKSAQDGALWSLNKFGHLNLDAVAKKMGMDKGKLIADMGDMLFQVPEAAGTYQLADEYLSGDIPDKLAVAKQSAQSNPEFQRNVNALQAAMPPPLSPQVIFMRLGMPWIPADVYKTFVRDVLQLGDANIAHSDAAGGWNVVEDNASTPIGEAQWSAPKSPAYANLTHAMNLTYPKIFNRWRDADGKEHSELDKVATEAAVDKVQALKNKFVEWSQEGETADNLANIYNREQNRRVLRKFDGAYLTTPGISADWHWRPHQRRGVARIILSGNTYLGHSVGAGKTSIMIGAAMEMRRLGLVKKPMFVVPKSMLGQFTKEFYEQYPQAKIMVADDRRFHTSRRKQFMANVAQEDLDAVIITHPSFKKIPLGAESQRDLVNEEIENLREALRDLDKQDDRHTIKRIEDQIAALEQRLSGAMGGSKDQTNTFEEMGVDFLFIDEAHEFRKLNYATRQQMKGIDPKGSDMAWDLYSKIHYLESKTPGRSTVLASGTPVTNTMAELYTISRYLQRPTLKQYGISHFDSWATSYGDTATKTEQNAAGGYESVTRFADFVNMWELYRIVGQIMDVVTPSQLAEYVVRPALKGGKRQMHIAPRTEFLDGFQESLARRMEAIKNRGRPPEKGEDIIFSVIGDGRLAAIDPRLMLGANPQTNKMAEDSKLNAMINNAADFYHRTHDVQFYDPASNYTKPTVRGPATQIIFANLGLNPTDTRAFNVNDEIRRQLIARGVKPDEIAFIKDHEKLPQRQKLYNDMNAGKVRILVGSTKKMGTGINVQKRLGAIHNLDPLWYPADDEQRMGRILRQGNMNPEIEANDYSTKGTYDTAMWTMMARKAGFIEQFFRGDPNLRHMEDLGEASYYEQAAAMATTDERVIQLTEMQQELEKMERRRQAHDSEQYSLRQTVNNSQDSIAYANRYIAALKQNIARRKDISGDKFSMKVGNDTFTTRKDATESLNDAMKRAAGTLPKGGDRQLGEIAGFNLMVHRSQYSKDDEIRLEYYLEGASPNYDIGLGNAETPGGIMLNAQDRVGDFEATIRWQQNDIKQAEAKIASANTQIGKPFTEGGKIETLKGEIYTLEAAIRATAAAKALPKATEVMPDKPPENRGPLTPDEEQTRRDLIDHYGQLDTAQVKRLAEYNWRKVKNAPEEDEDDAKMRREDEEAAPPFFSALTRGIEGAKQERAPAAQWDGVIRNMHGVKSDEVDWSDVREWLAQQKGPVTKQALVDFLKANNLQLIEVTKGESNERPAMNEYAIQRRADLSRRIAQSGGAPYELDLLQWLDDHPTATDREALTREYDLWLNDHPHLPLGVAADDLEELRETRRRTGPEIDAEINWLNAFTQSREDALQAEDRESKTDTRFATYQLPGGDEYHEFLITLPENATDPREREWRRMLNKLNTQGLEGPGEYARFEKLGAELGISGRGQEFRTGHWDEPNIVAHVRFNTRTDANGKKTLFLEEIQSDWHQKGRREGYQVKLNEAQKTAFTDELRDVLRKKGRMISDGTSMVVPHQFNPEFTALADRQKEIEQTLRGAGVPNAPFKTTWHELAFKRMLRYAAENGYDQIAWTTGAQQNARYSLSTHLDRVTVVPGWDGKFKWWPAKKGGGDVGTITTDKTGLIIKANDIYGDDIVGKNISDVFGEDFARKGLAVNRETKFSGLDLEIGGEGMTGFYDKMLPAFANKYARKWGARVGETTINTVPSRKDYEFKVLKYGAEWRIERVPALLSQVSPRVLPERFQTETAAQAHADRITFGAMDVHSLPVTPAMRDSVMEEGQPLFSRESTIQKVVRSGKRVQYAKNIIGEPVTRLNSKEMDILRAVAAEIVRIAPTATLKIANVLEEVSKKGKIGRIRGAVYQQGLRRVIALAMRSPDVMRTARHEVLHFLRAEGLIDDKEWATLEQAAKDGKWIQKHKIDKLYPDMNEKGQLEEAIAEEFGKFRQNPKDNQPKPIIQKLFERVAEFLNRFAARMRKMFGRDATAKDIIYQMDRGDMGKRSGNAPGNVETGPEGQAEPKFARSKPPPEDVEEADDAIDDIAEDESAHGGGNAAGLARGFPSPKGRPEKHLDGLRGKVERTVIFPRTLAATDWRSAYYWRAVEKKDNDVSRLLHEAAEGSQLYMRLMPTQKDALHAVEEIARLKGIVLENDGRSIVMENDLGMMPGDFMRLSGRRMAAALENAGIKPEDVGDIVERIKAGDQITLSRAIDQVNPPLAHSKFGDMIELDDKTTEAYFERRALYAQRWRDIMKGTAVKMGWDGEATPEALRNAAAAVATLGGSKADQRRLNNIGDLLEAMQEQERTGYVPFMRFGDYYLQVTHKPGKDKTSLGGFPRTIEFRLVESKPAWDFGSTTKHTRETPKTAQAAIDELRQRYPESTYDIQHGYLARNPELLRSLDIPALEKFLTALGQQDTEVFGPMVQNLLDQMFEELKAGFKKRASNVPGYSPDFERATGSYMHWTSHHVAKMVHGDAIKSAKERYIDTHPSKGTKHYWDKYEFDQNAPRSLMRGLQQFGFMWELAGNPSSSAAIALHGPMVANFTLGVGLGKTGTGTGTAAARLYPALAQVGAAIRANAQDGLSIDIANIRGISPEERAGLEREDKNGLFHSVATEEMMGLAQKGGDTSYLGLKRKNTLPLPGMKPSQWRRFQKIAGSNISVVDRMNRIAIWLAARRLARIPGNLAAWSKVWAGNQLFANMVQQEGLNPDNMARFMVDEAAFVWGKKNQPEFGRSTIGGLITQFRGFELRYLSSAWQKANRMGKEGKMSMLMMMAGLMTLAGALGLPFVGDIEDGIEDLVQWIDHVDPMLTTQLYSLMEDVGFSQRGAEMVLRGPSRVCLGIDLSNRLGFGNILGRDLDFAANPAAIAGAVPGILYNVATQGMDRLRNGQPLGAVGTLLPAAIRNPYLANVVYPNEGVRTRYQEPWNPPVVAPKDFDWTERVMKSLGFTTTTPAREYERREMFRRAAAAEREEAPPHPTQRSMESPRQKLPARIRGMPDPYPSPYPK